MIVGFALMAGAKNGGLGASRSRRAATAFYGDARGPVDDLRAEAGDMGGAKGLIETAGKSKVGRGKGESDWAKGTHRIEGRSPESA